MNTNYLVEVLSEFDINVKYFKISVKKQLNRNYGLIYWFLCLFSVYSVLINTFILILISDDDINSLKKYGSIGFKLGGKSSRLMLDISVDTFFCLISYLFWINFLDKMQWLLKMSSIYEEIRTKHFDKYLMNLAKVLSFYMKYPSIMIILLGDFICFTLFYNKWNQFVEYPIGFMAVIVSIQFAAKFSLPLVLRQFVIIIFFCRMHCFLFKTNDKNFSKLSKKYRKRNLKTYLLFHYKLCESVEEFQTFLRPMFVLITTTFCAVFCYMIYFNLKNSENENNSVMFLLNVAALIMLIFSLILSGVIAMIDIESKKGLHLIYGSALKLSNKELIFKVVQLT